jgi:hypothetical protein
MAPRVYDGRMSATELDPKIQPIDSTVQKLCHCGSKAKWTASLRLEGAQIRPEFQHQDLCKEHTEQFAAIHKLRFPPSDQPPARGSETELP